MLGTLATMRRRVLNPAVISILSSPFLGTASRSGSTLPREHRDRDRHHCDVWWDEDVERKGIRRQERKIYNKWEEICKGISEGRKKEWTSYHLYSHLDDPHRRDYVDFWRPVLGPKDLLKPKDVVIFQYARCPLANKVHVLMEYCEIPYIVVDVTPITKKQIKWSHNKELPIFVVDGQPTVDSSDLINKIVKRMHPDYDLNDDEEKKWREWVDNYLVHVLSAYLHRTFAETLETYMHLSPESSRVRGPKDTFSQLKLAARRFIYLVFPNPLQIPEYLGYLTLSERLEKFATLYGGAVTMYNKSRKFKRKHNITDERAALYGAAEQWMDALKGQKFLGGNNPNLADLAVYGALRSICFLSQMQQKDMQKYTRILKWCDDAAWGWRSRWDFTVISLRAERLNKGEFYNEDFAKV